jgi:prepilin-type N-terminal cleavage/methylation domain-containing protein
MLDKKKQKKNNKGMTLVEMIVSFALLGIFLAAAGIAISGPVKTYYYQRKTMSAYTVADAVLSEIRNDIQTARGGDTSADGTGYIKLRADDGTVVEADETGSCLEFAKTNSDGTAYAEQIDASGFQGGYLLKANGSAEDSALESTQNSDGTEKLPSGYLTDRYYFLYADEENIDYSKLYFDYIDENPEKNTASGNLTNQGKQTQYLGKKVARHVEQKLPVSFYQDFTIELQFSLSTETSRVNYITVNVTVKNPDLSSEYSKTEYIALENSVLYKTTSTLYSDGIPSQPQDGIIFKYNDSSVMTLPYKTEWTITSLGWGNYSYQYEANTVYLYNDQLYYFPDKSVSQDIRNPSIAESRNDRECVKIPYTEKDGNTYIVSENIHDEKQFEQGGHHTKIFYTGSSAEDRAEYYYVDGDREQLYYINGHYFISVLKNTDPTLADFDKLTDKVIKLI